MGTLEDSTLKNLILSTDKVQDTERERWRGSYRSKDTEKA